MQHEELHARRFTTSAANIVEQLPRRAADRGIFEQVTTQIVPTLALWAILRWERKVGLVALERGGADIEALARDIDGALSASGQETPRQDRPPNVDVLPAGCPYICVDFDALLQPLLTAAENEGRELRHDWGGSEHLLLAIIRLADPRLREILERHEITHGGILEAVRVILGIDHDLGRRGPRPEDAPT